VYAYLDFGVFATILLTAQLEAGLAQWAARLMNRRAQELLIHIIETEIHWVPRCSSISGNLQSNCQVNVSGHASVIIGILQQFHSASNMASGISSCRSAAKASWEANKRSKHFSYRLKGKAATKRPIPRTSVMSEAARSYQLKSGHAPMQFT